TETTKLRMDTQGSSVSANVNVYHATGNGFPDLQFLACSGIGTATTFLTETGETYYFQVGGFNEAGTIQFNLAEAPIISGRVTDAVTGAPLPGDTAPFTNVYLYRRCGDNCLEFANSQQA